jgi:nucleoside-diphosphate-sugar epimerase
MTVALENRSLVVDLPEAKGQHLVGASERILITGAAGFMGPRVVEALLKKGFRKLRCLVRPTSDAGKLTDLDLCNPAGSAVEILRGNLLNAEDCARAVRGVALIYHLAAGRGEKAFPDAFMNSVVTTRNLLDAVMKEGGVRRFVNVSSFAVYSNVGNPGRRSLDESSPVEKEPARRGDAYSFAKVRQEEIVIEYGKRFGVPHVIVRPGVVYGPGNEAIHGRVGIGSSGLFLHLGGANTLPLTFVENCAEAIVLAGFRPGVNGEVFNVVDDDLPSSRQFLQLYKRHVRPFRSIYVPHVVSYVLCLLWEKYSAWSQGQLPPVYNRSRWRVSWKRTRYTNRKIKCLLGWSQRVPTAEALAKHFESCRRKVLNA